MVILNASFIIDRGREDEFLNWFESLHEASIIEAADLGSEATGMGLRCRVSAMRDANGEDYTRAEAHTIAVQWEFYSLESAREWRDKELVPVMNEFMQKFQPDAIVFTSIFDVLGDLE